MQALILVGGEGTRLRPLTATVPKPVVTLVDRPFMAYMLEWLGAHGIDDVVMLLGFLADSVRDVLGDGSEYGVRLRYVEEPEAMGTGGAITYAADLLDERFVVLNGDVLTDLDLTAQIVQHERSGARATLALVPVEDPSAYGLVRLGEADAIEGFLEKPDPAEIDTNLVSAGAYVLEREVLDRLEPGPASIERDLFPQLVGAGLHGYRAGGYWLDIGTPERYLQATYDILERRVDTAAGRSLTEPRLIGAGCEIASDAHVAPLSVLGPGVTVGAGATVDAAVVLDGAVVGAGATVRRAIVAAGAHIGDGAQVLDGAVVGERAAVGAGNVITNDARVAPGESI